nr:zinc finger, CCHC-type [Tanacetum cinerariifolium]
MTEKDDTSKLKEIGSTTYFQCPVLKGTNYMTWAIRMQVILEANGLWEMIEPNEKTKADTKKDKTAIAFLYQALPEEQLLQIIKHKTAKAIWDALKIRHVGVNRVQQAKQQTLKLEFEILQMKENESIDSFVTRLTDIINKAASVGLAYEDSTLVRKLLNAVPDRFLQIVASIEQYSDLDEMSLDKAIGRLKTFEERLRYKKERPVNNQESLMFTRHEGQSKPSREYGQGRFNQSRGRVQDKNNYQSKKEERASFEEDTRDKSQVTCYRCQKLGHYAYECSNKRKNQARERSNLVEEDLKPTLLMENGHVLEISEGCSCPGISKCDTSASEEMNVGTVVKDNHVPEISVKIGRQLLTVTSPQQIQHNFLKRLLGSGFVVHMMENELLHDVFKFKPEKRKSGRELYVAERDEVGINLFVPNVIREENFRRIHNSQNSIFCEGKDTDTKQES